MEGDRFIVTVDAALAEALRGTEQVRFFAIEGHRLMVRLPERPSMADASRRAVTRLVFEREE